MKMKTIPAGMPMMTGQGKELVLVGSGETGGFVSAKRGTTNKEDLDLFNELRNKGILKCYLQYVYFIYLKCTNSDITG